MLNYFKGRSSFHYRHHYESEKATQGVTEDFENLKMNISRIY